MDSHVTIVRPIFDEYYDYLGLAVLNEQEVFERLGVGATGQTELSRQAIGEVKFVAFHQRRLQVILVAVLS